MLQHKLTSIYCSKKSRQQKFRTPKAVHDQLNGSFHQYWETKKCLHVRTWASKKGGKMKWHASPNSQSQSQMNEPVFYQYWNNATNFKKSNKIEWFLYEWRKIKTLWRWEESNRIINTLLDSWPANMAGYFYSSSYILAWLYCRLEKIPSHIGWSTV